MMGVIAKVYWRALQRGARVFAAIPESVQADVRALAKQDVNSGVLSAELYQKYIGEVYPRAKAEA